jgi:hypothetical protein
MRNMRNGSLGNDRRHALAACVAGSAGKQFAALVAHHMKDENNNSE